MKNRSTRNLKISTRITLSAVFGIIIPVVVAVIFSSVMLSSITSYFNFSDVTTNSYSMLNQIQWNQTMSSISNELVSEADREHKYNAVNGYVTSIENIGAKVYIECNGTAFYSTADRDTVLGEANNIISVDTERNVNYFGENGMVIITHAEKQGECYLVVVENTNYSVEDITARNTAQNFSSLVFNKTSVLFLLIVLLFILSIAALSFITSRTINVPIRKLTEGAKNIADGNLDFNIDYESTNEIGQTVKAFNAMTRRLKSSIEAQNKIEQSRKEMIAGIAHDLRTPLTSVKGYVEGIRDGIANTPEKQKSYMDTIYSSTLSMEKLLDELLTVSRLEIGNIELNKSDVNLTDFLNDCADELSVELGNEGFDFEFINKCSDSALVEIDVDRFSRVIQNIVSNSIKYKKPDVKGKIILEAQEYAKSVIISIKDNGIGLDSESLPRIFETFYRADKARTKVSEGSGLGLSVCKQLVELHGGQIWASSEEGNGLTVLISLYKKEETDE